ncbi:hypothetical protein CNR33_00020 [Pseudomonas phage tabernarius]|uniref:Uncharacterized protein n=1 Tax=Pseudomonas phage tabernarius TaxID=2048978 RepID=A0A2H4P6R2_9CAUD|nr:hypothetical protein FDJ17_gp20 [Pseudomonas phage tabernarius]ATW57866.1 hypothetical protein CNR33_00020 [Pseudomonas phage tabernarius]
MNRLFKFFLFFLLFVAYVCCFVSLYLAVAHPDPHWKITLAVVAATILHFVLYFFKR